MPRGGGDRRVPGGKERTGVSDHLFQPGLQDELAAHVDRAAVHYGNGAVCGDRSGGKNLPEKVLNPNIALIIRSNNSN